jgi:hypothetical protein
VPEFLRGLVDDAAIFPPGDAPLEEALTAHHRHRGSAYANLVGPFVVDDRRIAEVHEALPVSAVVSGGAGAIEPAVAWAAKGDLDLRGVEIPIRESDAGDLAPNVRRIVTAVDALAGDLDDDLDVYVEPPRLYGAEPSPSWLAALDELAAAGHCLKLRTGGPDADAFPSAVELATSIDSALNRELPFKCTAGLHHAVRHRDDQTGFEHHGFLNVLLATRVAFDGGSTGDVATVLDDHYPNDLVAMARTSDLAGARRWFTSYGSCSVSDPLDDLLGLGLLEAPHE